MALLPAGYADTGISSTFTLSLAVEMRAQRAAILHPWARFDNNGLAFTTRAAAGATDLGCVGLFVGTGIGVLSFDAMEMLLINDVTGGSLTYHVVATGAGSCTPGWLGPVTCEKVIGPLRLGVTWQNDRWLYRWFVDAASTVLHKVGGVTYRTQTFADPPALSTYTYGIGPLLGDPHFTVVGQGQLLQFSRIFFGRINPGDAGSSLFTHIRFSNFSADNGSGAAAITIGETTEYNATIATASAYRERGGPMFGCNFVYTADLACDETSGAAVAADATWEGARVCPAVFTVTKPMTGITGSLFPTNYDVSLSGLVVPTAVLADPWLSAQTVRPYTADQSFRFEGQTPLSPSAASPAHFSCGSITIAASLSMLQSSNAWAITLGAGTVGGTPTVPVFTITTAPASVTRAFRESWRDWNNSGSGDYQPTDQYQATKHDAFASGSGDERWASSLFSYLDIDLTAPASASPTILAVAILYAYPVTAGSPGTIDTFEVTYSAFTFPAGVRSTQRVDLMFPVELQSRPFYGERIDSIRLINLQTGVTTVHSLTLVAAEQAYITLSGRSELLADSTTRHTGIVLSMDGSAPSLLWGQDQAIVPTSDADGDGYTDARGDHQNGRFVENGVTGVLLGRAPGMRAALLADAFAELHRMEGITATYSDTALLAALTGGNELGFDALGNPAPVPRVSTWFNPILPHARITAGTPYDVRAQFVVSGIVIPCGLTAAQMRIFQRNHLGQVLEALATDGNFNRHGAAVTVNARGYTGGAPATGDTLLGTGSTDASGFVTIGVRTGTLGATGLDISSYLTGA